MLAGLQKAYGTPYWTSRGFPLGGLGACDETGCDDPGSGGGGGVNPFSMACTCVGGVCAENGNSCGGGGGIIPTGPAAPGGSSFNYPRLFNTIATDFSTIFKAVQPVPAGCTQVAGPYGTSVSCANPGQPAAGLNLPTASSLTSFLPLLLGGGLLVFAIKAFSGGGK